MPAHEHFEELCTLAVLGQLDQWEYTELARHLANCEICRAAYCDFSELTGSILPLCERAQQPRTPSSRLPAHDELRHRFLRRAREEGCAISDDAAAHQRFTWRMRWPRIPVSYFVTGICLATLMVTVGFLWRADQIHRTELNSVQRDLAAATGRLAANDMAAQRALADVRNSETADAELVSKLHESERQVQDLERALEGTKLERSRVQEQLAREVAANTELEHKAASDDLENKVLRSQLEDLRAASERKVSEIVALQYRVAELSDQVKDQAANLAREKELLSAGREIRDLMGARNLHIIDVQDVSVGGKHQPYGRIFLTEGKSLIFFAYDLEQAASRSASFQAWGQREGGSRKAASLGILAMDDRKQSRWLLKVEDPKLLSEIDSVFVTVEPAGGGTKPAGKKLLYAYLHNPINHP